MAYNNIDQAVTIPVNEDLSHFAMQLYANSERKKALQEQENKQAIARQDMLSKYIGTQFQDKNHLTGTAYDPVIDSHMRDAQGRVLGLLKSNPNMSMADLQSIINKEAGNVDGVSLAIKNTKAAVDAQAKEFEKQPGVDANAFRQLAMTNAFYKTDPNTGAKVLKPFNEFDPSVDYGSQAIQQHPELIAKGDEGLRNYLKTFQPQDVGDTQIFENKGTTTEHKYQAKVPAYMELNKDAKGKVTGVKVRGEKIPGITNPNGTPLEVVDGSTYKNFNDNPASSIALHSMFKSWNDKQKTKLDYDSPEADIIKRKLLYDYLGNNGVYEYKPETKVTNASFIDKMQAGIPLWKPGTSPEEKQAKLDAKVAGYDPSLLLRGIGGEDAALQGANNKDVGGKNYYDMTQAIGGMVVKKDKDNKPVYASSVSVDPVSGAIRVETPNAKDPKTPDVTEYKGKDIRKFVKQTAEYNGLNFDKAERSLNLYLDKDGNYIGKKNPDFYKNLAKVQFQKDKALQDAKDAAPDNFQSSGNLGDLKPIIGAKTTDGGHILDVKSYKGLFGSPYTIIIQKGDKTIKVPLQTQDDVSAYIKEHTKPQ